MNNTKTIVTTVVVVLAVAILVFTLRPSPTTDLARFEMLELRLEELEQQIAELGTKTSGTDLKTGVSTKLIKNKTDQLEDDDIEKEVLARLQNVENNIAHADLTLSETIEERVEEVVDEKVDELEKKQDKKPSLTVFTEVLKLTEDQRRTVDEEVWQGQNEVRTILETPTADGSILIDELIEVAAYGVAKYPEANPRLMKLFGRLLSEKIPGTDTTYGAEIEAVKNNVREAFRSEFTEEQYAEFESWGVDPTEIKEIGGSPWADIEKRVQKRVRELIE